MSNCFCGADDCRRCHPEHFHRNEFGRQIYNGDDEDEEIDPEDEDIDDDPDFTVSK